MGAAKIAGQKREAGLRNAGLKTAKNEEGERKKEDPEIDTGAVLKAEASRSTERRASTR